jgi:hypothetical protein
VLVAIKGHPVRPELSGRPTLLAQAVFSFFYKDRFQEEHTLTEASPEFQRLTAAWGGTFIKKPVDAFEVKSHQPRRNLDLTKIFSVGASGGKRDEDSMVAKLFTKVMRLFLKKFKESNGNNYKERDVHKFSKEMKARFRKIKKIQAPDMKNLKGTWEPVFSD